MAFVIQDIGDNDKINNRGDKIIEKSNEILNRMGATAVNIPGGEIMSSFQSGVVDAVEWGGPWMDLAFGFPKIAKICYGPGIHSPGANLELLIKEAIDVDLTEKTILVHLLAKGVSEDRTASNLLQGLFVRHWFEHVAQLNNIRIGLGI